MSLSVKIENPIGLINGSNTLFTVSNSYIANSVSVYLNGQLVGESGEAGWIETSPVLGQVTVNTAPIVGDEIQIFYIYNFSSDSTGAPEKIIELIGKLTFNSRLNGELRQQLEITTDINQYSKLKASVDLTNYSISGIITKTMPIIGIIKKCE